ncbi:MAG: ParB/RepB/Spo0J family partition protein, partial [Labrys sp. (in: a-proteobacteria)]
AKVIGKSRSHVANTLRLVKLPDAVKRSVIAGDLSAGHARALLSVSDPERLAERIVKDGLTVRDVEAIAQVEAEGVGKVAKSRARGEKDADTLALEKALSDALGLKVSIDHRGASGEVKIRYRSLDQLDEVCRRLQA